MPKKKKEEKIREIKVGGVSIILGEAIPNWLKEAFYYGLYDFDGIANPAAELLKKDPTMAPFGSAYDLGRVMEGDYRGLLQTRVSALLTKPRVLKPADLANPATGGGEVKAQEAFKLAQEAINRLDVDSILAGIWEAVPRGFSVVGNIYTAKAGNIYPPGGRIELVDVKPYPQDIFTFKRDGSLWLKVHGQPERPLPSANFTVTRFYLMPSNSFYNPYGWGLNWDLFKPWLITDYIVRFWSGYAERFGGQVPVVYYDNPDDQEKALALARSLVNAMGIALPEGSHLEFPTPDRRGSSDVFATLVDFCEKKKAKIILGQTESSERTPGSLGNSTLSREVKREIQISDSKVTFNTFSQKVLGNWLKLQLGDDVPLPTYKAQIIEDEDLFIKAKVWNLVPVKKDPQAWHDNFYIPVPEGGPEIEERLPLGPYFSESSAIIKKKTMKNEVFKKGLPIILAGYAALTGAVAEEIALATDHDDASRRLDSAFGGANSLSEALAILRLNANLAARAAVQKQITDKFIPPPAGPKAGGFAENDEYEKAQTYIKSRELLEGEIPGGLAPEDFHFVPPEKALEFWATKIPLTNAEFDALVGAERLEAFTVAGVESTRLLGQVKDEIQRSLETGETFYDFQRRVEDIFDDAGITQLSSGHLQLVYENNIGTAYEMGNYASLHDDLARQLFPYFQYLTMDDPDVRENHLPMHELVFRRDDPIWNIWWPLNGHRCRCTVVGLMKEEGEAIGISDGALIMVRPDPGWESGPGYPMAA